LRGQPKMKGARSRGMKVDMVEEKKEGKKTRGGGRVGKKPPKKQGQGNNSLNWSKSGWGRENTWWWEEKKTAGEGFFWRGEKMGGAGPEGRTNKRRTCTGGRGPILDWEAKEPEKGSRKVSKSNSLWGTPLKLGSFKSQTTQIFKRRTLNHHGRCLENRKKEAMHGKDWLSSWSRAGLVEMGTLQKLFLEN